MKRPAATRPAQPRAAQRTVRVAVPAPRNPVATALAGRRASGAAGKHLRSVGAQRRAERVALDKAVRSPQCE